MEWLGTLDDRTVLMLRYVDAALAAGAMPIETARDFVTRIALLHRYRAMGCSSSVQLGVGSSSCHS